MPTGVYIKTAEHRKNLSKANKGQIPWSKGLTKETDKRIKGHIAWNKGLTKETDLRVAKYSKARENFVTTEKTKKKISESLKGRKFSIERKKKLSEIREGHLTSRETRKKISESLLGHPVTKKARKKMGESHKGEKSHFWKGGISFEPYSIRFNKELKELIRNRDSYKCQLCSMSECENLEKLSIHHVDYNKKNSLPSNLISLCRGCNSKVNHNRDKWEIYFKKKIKKIISHNEMGLGLTSKIKKGNKIIEALI